MVLALVLLPALATVTAGDGVPTSRIVFYLLVTLAKVSVFVAIMLIVGRRLIPWLMHHTAHTGSRELFRLAVYAIALGVAFGAAKLFDVSFALGAFFAGMVMGESDLSQRATEEAMPLRDAFAVLFFVSVGMLLEPDGVRRGAARRAGDGRHHRDRQVGRRLADRARLPAFQFDRAHRRGEPRPDRRVLLHPDRARHGARDGAQGGARPGPGGRHRLDHPQSAGVHPDGAAEARSCPEARQQRAGRHGGRIPADQPQRPRRADRLWPRRLVDRPGARQTRHEDAGHRDLRRRASRRHARTAPRSLVATPPIQRSSPRPMSPAHGACS